MRGSSPDQAPALAPTRRPKGHRKRRSESIPMISVLTVVPRLEGRPEIAVLDGHERDRRIDGASVCIDGLDLGSCTDAPRSFQKLLRREGKELGLKTLADNFGFFGPLLFGSSLALGFRNQAKTHRKTQFDRLYQIMEFNFMTAILISLICSPPIIEMSNLLL
ncbi:hypothetical protein CXB51_023948 [Gossypium anomalum]|uniref:Uncharacterized protein n=1 Tax=Gossypium anomalum TaxID=47600 RepID=A0A8J6CWJ2_9ROSI|nr:hypothetical protein CXB51_023948 [Gossypium anomalum]